MNLVLLYLSEKKTRTNRTLNGVKNILREHCSFHNTGIPRFTLLMWGHIKKPRKAKNRGNQGMPVQLELNAAMMS